MAGIVEAVTKELEPEDPFEDLGRRSLSHFKLQSPLVSSFLKRTLVETLLEITT